jgi:hypothetical protein
MIKCHPERATRKSESYETSERRTSVSICEFGHARGCKLRKQKVSAEVLRSSPSHNRRHVNGRAQDDTYTWGGGTWQDDTAKVGPKASSPQPRASLAPQTVSFNLGPSPSLVVTTLSKRIMKQSLSATLISPLGIMCISLLFWLACFLAPFNTYTVRPDPVAILLLAGYIAAFICGTLFLRKTSAYRFVSWTFEPRTLRIAYSVLLIVAFLGLAMKAYVLLAVDRFASYDTVAAYRMAKLDDTAEPSGPLSQVATALYPVSLIAYMISFYLRDILKLWQRIMGATALLLFVGYFAIAGGRTLLMTAFIMIAVAIFLRGVNDPRFEIDRRKMAAVGVGVLAITIAFVLYSAHIITDRLAAIGFTDPLTYLGTVETDREFHLEEPYRNMLNSDNPVQVSAILTGSSLTYYANHGFFNFSDLYHSEQGRTPLGGEMEFHIVLTALQDFGFNVPNPDEATDRIPKPGLFYTAFGNILIDYGVAGGLIYCFLLGAFVKGLYLKAQAGSLIAMLLYPFFASVIFHLPILDMIAGGYGLFVAFAAVVSIGILKLVGYLAAPRKRKTSFVRTSERRALDAV